MPDDGKRKEMDPGIGSDGVVERVPDEDATEPGDERTPVDDLIISVLNGTASPFEEERLRRWREAEAVNEDHFQELVQVWALTQPEPTDVTLSPPTVEMILDLAEAEAGGGLGASPGPSLSASHDAPHGASHGGSAGRRGTWRWIGLLAASVAAIGLGLGTLLRGPAPMAEYAAEANHTLTVTLADGSFVRLAPGAVLQEWEVEGSREVSLDGKAFFAVARDEDRPFVVRTDPGTVTVLGTRFQVLAHGETVETAVVEGLVQVANEVGSVDVAAGSVSTMTRGEAPSATEVDDVLARLDWPDGVLVFQATPLQDVVDEVGRHYGRTISIQSTDLARRRITAWFEGEAFEAVTESLCLVTEAVCQIGTEHIMMGTGGGSEPR